jgi:hypothetical protein
VWVCLEHVILNLSSSVQVLHLCIIRFVCQEIKSRESWYDYLYACNIFKEIVGCGCRWKTDIFRHNESLMGICKGLEYQ